MFFESFHSAEVCQRIFVQSLARVLAGGAKASPYRPLSPGFRPLCDTRKDMYKRIVLKLSGEALAGPRGFGIDAEKVSEITGEIAEIHALGVEVGIVVGGGNIFRGVEGQAREMDRVAADSMGMLSTVINAIA